MGAGPRGDAQGKIAQNQNTSNQQTTNTSNWLNPQYNQAGTDYTKALGDATGTLGDAKTGYQDFMAKGAGGYALTPEEIDALWYGGGASGGIDQSLIDSLGADTKAGYQNFAQTGGMSQGFKDEIAGDVGNIKGAVAGLNASVGADATQLEGMNQLGDLSPYLAKDDQAISGFQQMGRDAGLDPDAQQKMLANGTYDEYMRTGGFSQKNLQDIRSRSISPLASTYAQAGDQLAQQRALQGGYGGNYSAANSQMARHLGQDAAQASTNTEAGIAQMVQQGREFGATGMTQAETAYEDLLQRGKVAGLTGALQGSLAEGSQVLSADQLHAQSLSAGAQARIGAADTTARGYAMAGGLSTQVQALESQMKLAGLGGMTDIEKAQLSAELQNAAINEQGSAVNASLQAQKAMMQFQGMEAAKYAAPAFQLSGLQGLTNVGSLQTGLAGLTANKQNSLLNSIMQNNQMMNNNNMGYSQQMLQSYNLPTGFGNFMDNLGKGASALGNVFGGLGGLQDLTGKSGSGYQYHAGDYTNPSPYTNDTVPTPRNQDLA